MTNDIVARLRQTHPAHCKCFGCEAADEIERLRAENTQLRIERDSYLHSFDVAIGLPDDSEDDSEGDPRVEDHYGE